MSKVRTTSTTVVERDEWNTVLAQLRVDGFSPIESIKITRTVLHVSLGDAKLILQESGVWADLNDDVAELHDALEAAATEFGAVPR